MHPNLTIVVAIDRQRGIGIGNALPWKLPQDLAYFKRTTTGHPIIMGRKTFDSIGRPLPNRRNIVVTRNRAWQHAGVEAVGSLAEAVALTGDQTAFIIGGGQIFIDALPQARTLLVTEIDRDFACDVFFPAIDPDLWRESARETHHSDELACNFAFVTYQRS